MSIFGFPRGGTQNQPAQPSSGSFFLSSFLGIRRTSRKPTPKKFSPVLPFLFNASVRERLELARATAPPEPEPLLPPVRRVDKRRRGRPRAVGSLFGVSSAPGLGLGGSAPGLRFRGV